MNRRMRAAAAAAVLVGATALSGCAMLDEVFKPSIPERTPSAIEACAMGATWRLDTAALQEQLVAGFARAGIGVTEVLVEGTESWVWDADGTATIDSDYRIVASAPSDVEETPYVVTQTVQGVSTGRVFFSDVIAIPRDWDDSGLDVETTAVRGEEALETPPFSIPRMILDDVVGLQVQCTDASMTTQGRGQRYVLTWTRG